MVSLKFENDGEEFKGWIYICLHTEAATDVCLHSERETSWMIKVMGVFGIEML